MCSSHMQRMIKYTCHFNKLLLVSDPIRTLSLYMKHPVRVAPSNTSCSEDPKPENLNPHFPNPKPITLFRLVPSPGQFVHSGQDIDEARLTEFGWPGHPVSSSDHPCRLVRPPRQFVRSDRKRSGLSGRPGDLVSSSDHPLRLTPSVRALRSGTRSDRPVTRSGWSGRPVSASVQNPQVGPVTAPLGPVTRQFARSPVQVGPVARSFGPFRPANRPGPVDWVWSVAQSVVHPVTRSFCPFTPKIDRRPG